MSDNLAPGDVATRMAAEHGVSRRTLFRSAKYAAATDRLAATVAPDLLKRIYSGENRTPQSTIIRAAELVDTDPDEARRLVYGGKGRPTPRSTWGRLVSAWNAATDAERDRLMREAGR